MDAIKVLSRSSVTTRNLSSLYSLGEFEIYENYLKIFRLEVYGSYYEDQVRPKRFVLALEHGGIVEVKLGNSFQQYRFSEGDLIMIEKGFKHRWIGNPMTLLVIQYDV